MENNPFFKSIKVNVLIFQMKLQHGFIFKLLVIREIN